MEKIKGHFVSQSKTPPLIAVSNMHAGNLLKLMDMEIEGLPCPSVQIRPLPENDQLELDNSLLSFGDISFVFDQHNIFGGQKTLRKNDASRQITAGDAYTLRFPNVRFSQHIKARNQFVKKLHDIARVEQSVFTDSFVCLFDRKDKYYLVDEAKRSFDMKLLFIQEAGLLDTFKPVYVEKKPPHEPTGALKTLLSGFDQDAMFDEGEHVYRQQEIKDFITTKAGSYMGKKWVEKLTDETGNLSALKLFEAYKTTIEYANGKSLGTKLDKEATQDALELCVTAAEKSMHVTYGESVNYDLFCIYHSPKIDDNNQEVCLDSIVTYMKRNRGEGTEQGNFGNIHKSRAKTLPALRSMDDLVDHLDWISDDKQPDVKTINLFSELTSHHVAAPLSCTDEDEYTGKLLLDLLMHSTVKTNVQLAKAFAEMDIVKVPTKTLEKFRETAQAVYDHKYAYYEAKLNNGFVFKHENGDSESHMKAVILPDDVSAKIKTYFEDKTDVKIYMYDHKKPSTRLDAMRETGLQLTHGDTTLVHKKKSTLVR
jgi:hypothetical protein